MQDNKKMRGLTTAILDYSPKISSTSSTAGPTCGSIAIGPPSSSTLPSSSLSIKTGLRAGETGPPVLVLRTRGRGDPGDVEAFRSISNALIVSGLISKGKRIRFATNVLEQG